MGRGLGGVKERLWGVSGSGIGGVSVSGSASVSVSGSASASVSASVSASDGVSARDRGSEAPWRRSRSTGCQWIYADTLVIGEFRLTLG